MPPLPSISLPFNMLVPNRMWWKWHYHFQGQIIKGYYYHVCWNVYTKSPEMPCNKSIILGLHTVRKWSQMERLPSRNPQVVFEPCRYPIMLVKELSHDSSSTQTASFQLRSPDITEQRHKPSNRALSEFLTHATHEPSKIWVIMLCSNSN